MTRSPFQHASDQVIRLMAETLVLPPAVEPYRIADCADRWREQRIAEICINEFGDDARAEARRLLQAAGDAGQGAIPPSPFPVSMTDRRDGGRVSGNPNSVSEEDGASTRADADRRRANRGALLRPLSTEVSDAA